MCRQSFLCGVVLVLTQVSLACAASTNELRAILTEYERKYASINTIGIKYREHREPVLPAERLYRDHQMILWGDQETQVIYHNDGRTYYREIRPMTAKSPLFFNQVFDAYPTLKGDVSRVFGEVPFDVAKTLLDQIKAAPQPRTLIFDGTSLWQFYENSVLAQEDGTKTKSFVSVDPARLQNHYVPTSMLDHLLFAFNCPFSVHESKHRSDNRLSQLLESGSFQLASERVDINGVNCVVLRNDGNEDIFLAPTLGYAVIKRQWFRDGAVIYEVKGDDFEEVTDGIWFPRKIIATEFAGKNDAEGIDFGKARYRAIISIDEIRVNAPSDGARFSVSVPAGSIVIDETRRPVDIDGQVQEPVQTNAIPAVTYVQPADARDVEKVIGTASLKAGKKLADARDDLALLGSGTGWRKLLIWFNIGLIGALLALVMYRRLGRDSAVPRG